MAQRWPMIDPGELRTPVLIQALLPTSPPTFNSAGETYVWQTILGGGYNNTWIFARIEPVHAGDVIKGGQNVSDVEVPITLRFNPLITANCRILTYLGPLQSTYIIKGAVNQDERNVLITWTCLALGLSQ